MLRETVLCLSLVVGMSVAGGVNAARAADAKAGAAVDLSGHWKLDPDQSDMPGRPGGWGRGMRGRPPGGMGGRGGYPGGGGMGGGMEGGMRPPGGMRRPPMEEGGRDSLRRRPPGPPMMMNIQQKNGVLSFSDSTGALVREIDTAGGATDDTVRAGGAAAGVQHVRGQWKKDRLETTRLDRRGTKRTETYRLEDKGKTLVVETRIEIEGRGTRTMKQVYHRVNG